MCFWAVVVVTRLKHLKPWGNLLSQSGPPRNVRITKQGLCDIAWKPCMSSLLPQWRRTIRNQEMSEISQTPVVAIMVASPQAGAVTTLAGVARQWTVRFKRAIGRSLDSARKSRRNRHESLRHTRTPVVLSDHVLRDIGVLRGSIAAASVGKINGPIRPMGPYSS